MSGRNKFRELARPIDEDPARRARVEELGHAYDALISLHELREAAGATQADVARGLGVSQPYVAKIERRADMSLTTLSSYLAVLGGRLEIRAVFPEHPEENVVLALPSKGS
ncbi:MAG: helix-turn-helix transcriptional regulator [Rubrobacter sp.]|jgi:DNA-binding XRE family transcriptional regulator|nr:helix-turn-helix transcriptional regulator [Rubrobacter sp.]